MDRSPAPAAGGAHGGHAVALAGAHETHPSRAGLYTGIFVILFVVTGVEVAVTYVPGLSHTVLAAILLALAALKFFLIASFYMHLKYDSRVFAAFFILGLIIATGMLFSFLALFTAHYREPYTASQPATLIAPGTGGAAATATPGTGR
jgi:cytochrome c oxidase subunit IV